MKRLVAPSLLSADFLHLGQEMQWLNASADLLHLDVMDGTFVPNISFGFPVVEAVARVATIPLDVHLMIVHPERYVDRFAQAGAAMISFHLEAVLAEGGDPAAILRQIRSHGVKAGLAVNPDIPVEKLYPYLGDADFVLVMSVFAGFGGQSFIPDTYERVRQVRDEIRRQGLSCSIEVDGGVSSANARPLAEAGVEMFVAGSAVFKASDPAAEIQAIRTK